MAKSLYDNWGRTMESYGTTHNNVIHHAPVFTLTGNLYDDGHFTGHMWAKEGGGKFGYTMTLVWKFENGEEQELYSVTGYGFEADIDSWLNMTRNDGKRHSSVQLWMRCTAYLGGQDCEGNEGDGWDISSPITLGTVPTWAENGLTNNEPYVDDNGKKWDNISKFENKIVVQTHWNPGASDAPTDIEWHLGTNQHSNSGLSNPHTYNDLNPGTQYRVAARPYNGIGNADPAWKELFIRTLHSIPSANISSINDNGLETIKVNWGSDKQCQDIQYSIDGSGWITYESGQNKSSGTITIYTKNGADLYPNTGYNIKIRVRSIDNYDRRWSNESATINVITRDIAYLTAASPRNLTFGQPHRIIKTNPSGNRNQVRIQVGNPLLLLNVHESPNNDYSATFSQAELDAAYMKYPNPANGSLTTQQHNQITLKTILVTYGRSREYTAEYNGVMILTGNAFTTWTKRTGESSPRRGKAHANTGSNGIRPGVAWISTSPGVWRRGK